MPGEKSSAMSSRACDTSQAEFLPVPHPTSRTRAPASCKGNLAQDERVEIARRVPIVVVLARPAVVGVGDV